MSLNPDHVEYIEAEPAPEAGGCPCCGETDCDCWRWAPC